jgi:rare lipoprotein A
MVKWLLIAGAAYYFWPRSPTSAAPGKRGELGIASWYGPGYYGNKTASGEVFTGRQMTAAHKKLPFGTNVRVTDLDTGKNITVKINDRGPFVPGRIIDLSEKAAEVLGIKHKGLANVKVERL